MKFRTVVLALTLCFISAAVVAGRQNSSEPSVDEIIHRFAAAESEMVLRRRVKFVTLRFDRDLLGFAHARPSRMVFPAFFIATTIR